MAFYEKFIGYNPDDKQVEFLNAYINPDIKHIVNIWSRQTGKSTITGGAIAHRLIFGDGLINKMGKHVKEYITCFAPIDKQSYRLYEKVNEVLSEKPMIAKLLNPKRWNSHVIETVDGNVCEFGSASPNSHIRSPTSTMIVVDESQHVTDTKYYNDILPMGATTGAKVIESGTPFERNHFYKSIANGGVDAHGNVLTKIFTKKWFECPFTDHEFVLRQKARMPKAFFDQEYMCVFPASGSVPFPTEQIEPLLTDEYKCLTSFEQVKLKWKSAIAPYIENGATLSMGVDLGKVNDPTVISVVTADPFPIRLLYQEELPLGQGYEHIIGAIGRAYDTFQPSEFNIDYTSEKGVTDMLIAAGINVPDPKPNSTQGLVVFNQQTKTAMITHAQALVAGGQKRLQLPRNNEVLFYQMTSQQYEMTAAQKYKFFHAEGEHDDHLWSFLLAVANTFIDTSDVFVEETGIEANVWKKPEPIAVGKRFGKDSAIELEDEDVGGFVAARRKTPSNGIFSNF